MWRAAGVFIFFGHGRGDGSLLSGGFIYASTNRSEARRSERLPPNDVELRGTAAPTGIHLVRLARHGQCPAAVVVIGEIDFGCEGFFAIGFSQKHAGSRVARGGIAGLNHEIANDAVEE